MQTIILKKLVLDNFKCFQHKEVNFSQRTLVKGRNGIGKTSLYNAVLWLLFDKDINGNSADKIRPHDNNGVDIHNTEITVAATFDVNGREITLKKIQKENWVKRRGTDTTTFQGNVNEFSVNDIPKSLKDYKEYVSTNFAVEDVFLACSNAQSFFRLDTKKRRAKLMALANSFTDSDVIATDSSFTELANVLADGTVDEVMKRSKDIIKRLNAELESIPTRIDEQSKSKVGIDVAEVELEKQVIVEEIESINQQLEEFNVADDKTTLKKELAEITNKRAVMQSEADKDNSLKRNELNMMKSQLSATLSNNHSQIERNNHLINAQNDVITNNEKKIKNFQTEWKVTNAMVFDESSTKCRYCGAEYPAEKKDTMRADFERHKAESLESIVAKGKQLRIDTNIDKETVKKIETETAELTETCKQLEAQIKSVEDELATIPATVDLSDNAEYKALSEQLAEKNSLLLQPDGNAETRTQLNEKKSSLAEKYNACTERIALSKRNIDIDERISQLQAEQIATSQKIADENRILNLLEKFNKAKMTMLTESVNRHFKLVKWVLFQDNINGGVTDVCRCTVNGSDYDQGLNDSDCLLANIDILETFQKMNDINLPIFLDRAESINDIRIPQTEGQLILLKVSEDTEMVVE